MLPTHTCLTTAPSTCQGDPIAPRHQGDLSQVVFVIIFILITLAKLIGSVLEQKPNRTTGPRPTYRPSRADDATEAVRQFLERAARQKREGGSLSAGPRAAPANRSGRTSAGDVVDAELMPADMVAGDKVLGGQSVSEHVQRHLGGEHLGHSIPKLAQADEQLESHLHQVFDHRLGEIAKNPPTPIREGTDDPALLPHESTPKPPSTSFAQRIADQLRNPDQVRQAIILHEILRRPTDRL